MWPFGRTKVTMLVSVADRAAGRQYRLPRTTADRFILRGYAEGQLSREFSEEEAATERSNHQVILFHAQQ